jgi:hypothetical protein
MNYVIYSPFPDDSFRDDILLYVRKNPVAAPAAEPISDGFDDLLSMLGGLNVWRPTPRYREAPRYCRHAPVRGASRSEELFGHCRTLPHAPKDSGLTGRFRRTCQP